MIASIAPPSQSPTGLPWSTLKHLLQDISGITALTQQATGWATPFLLSLSSAAAPSGIPPYLSGKATNRSLIEMQCTLKSTLMAGTDLSLLALSSPMLPAGVPGEKNLIVG